METGMDKGTGLSQGSLPSQSDQSTRPKPRPHRVPAVPTVPTRLCLWPVRLECPALCCGLQLRIQPASECQKCSKHPADI